jgi:hypothetical protein
MWLQSCGAKFSFSSQKLGLCICGPIHMQPWSCQMCKTKFATDTSGPQKGPHGPTIAAKCPLQACKKCRFAFCGLSWKGQCLAVPQTMVPFHHFWNQKQPVSEITQPCVHTCNSLFICQLYSLPDLLEETDCKEDTPLTLPLCIIRFLLTVDNSDMN